MGSNGFVFEAQSRQKDSSVICAFNDGYIDGDIMFGPTSVAVAGTVKNLNDLFCTSFAINQADTKAGVPGILYGRYQGDGYAGGNPWVLLTSALAELLYRGAAETMRSGKLESDSYAAWAPIVGLDSSNSTLRYDSNT